MTIAGYAIGAETLFIYLRDEYPAVREILRKEIARVEAAGLAKHTTSTSGSRWAPAPTSAARRPR